MGAQMQLASGENFKETTSYLNFNSSVKLLEGSNKTLSPKEYCFNVSCECQTCEDDSCPCKERGGCGGHCDCAC
jgi:hypothetical protein